MNYPHLAGAEAVSDRRKMMRSYLQLTFCSELRGSKLLAGGGGKTICLPPNIFIGGGGDCPTVGSFFIFRLENVQSGAG